MSLRFIAGTGGSGKSQYIYENLIRKSLEESGRSFYVIVPEQYSMQTQSELVKLHPSGCITNIDVLNFTRLSHRVFEETGFNSGPVLDDTGKVLVLRKMAQELSGDLSVLGAALEKQGAASLIKSLISEFMQYRVTPGELEKLCEKGALSPSVKVKLEDIKKIYEAFLGYTEGKYITAEEMPQILSRRLERTDFLKDADVVLDGFTGFVPSQMEVIEKLFVQCRNVTVVLTMDTEGEAADILRGKRSSISKSNLFRMSGETALAIMRIAAEKKIEVLPPVFIGKRQSGSPDLSFLCENIYRRKAGTFTGKSKNIFITPASDSKDEITGIAETIRSLIRTGKYRYRDFAVITGDPASYDDIAEEIFGSCGIPCFRDRKKPVISNPAVEFIRSAIGLMTEGFSYRSVFRFLRCGMTEFTREETDLLETYVLAAGVKGFKKYQQEWTREFRTVDQELLERINEIRTRFAASLLEYTEAMRIRGSSVEEKTKAVYYLMEKNRIQEKCQQMADVFEEMGDNALFREYVQIYRIIIDDLDKLIEILGPEKISLKGYEQLTEAVFTERRLGIIPSGIDRVTIGDIERSRLSDVKILFLAGANEGLIPAPVSGSSLLSQGDRDQLKKNDVILAPDEREELFRQRFYMYLTLSKPSERIYISWAGRDADSRALLPSVLIAQIGKLFPEGIAEAFTPEERQLRLLETAAGREKLLTEGFQNLRNHGAGEVFLELCSWYAGQKEQAEVYKNARDAFASSAPETKIDPNRCRELYGSNILFSATRLESFAGCAFSHFIRYGLGLNRRDVLEWSALERGSLVHKALQYFINLEMKEGDGFGSRDRILELSSRSFDMALMEYSARLPEDSRSSFSLERLKEVVNLTAFSVAEQIRRGSFRPFAAELPYRTSGVQGVIDRLDLCEHDGITYFRVIDYKTGSEKLDLSRLYYGSKIQLPLYMKAVEDLRKTMPGVSEPAGIYYYNLSDPIIETQQAGQDMGADMLPREMRLTGLTREEPEILRLTDENLTAGASSDIVNVSMNRDGTPSARSDIASYDDFGVICRYTELIVEEMKDRIMEGEAGIHPLADGKRSACDWCEYRGICRFDRRIPGYAEKICQDRNKKEAIAAMAGRL